VSIIGKTAKEINMAKYYTRKHVISKFKEYIDKHYKTQAAAAYDFGITPGAVTNYLKGTRALPEHILSAMGLEAVDLYRRKR